MNQPNPMGLCGHWPLLGDARNTVADRAHGVGNVAYGPDGAVFDGRGTSLAIHGIEDDLHGERFTMAVNVWIDSSSAESIGDIASKFDVQRRTGFNWSVVDHGGVTSASSNYRNLNFAMDAGTEPRWVDRGRPGNARHICALSVHRGDLYAATFEHGDQETGGVFRHAGGDAWENTQLPCATNCVFSLASLDGTLYAVSGRYDPRNSAMPDVGNMKEEMRAWRLDAGGKWQDCGVPCAGNGELCMLGIYRGRLYATPSFRRGLFRYEGDKTWAMCQEPYPRFLSLCQWRGHLYGASNKSLRELGPPPEREIRFIMLPDADGVYRYDDGSDAWAGCGDIPVETQMYAFAVHRGALHTGTWPSSKVYRSSTGVGWEDCGRLHPDEKEVMAMCVYNGMLYAGTLPAADIYRLDADARWTKVGNVDSTPDVKYRRAWSMAVHDGGLFVGALPSGHIWEMRTGSIASDSHQLTTGWHHVAAVREGSTAKIYVDGQMRGQCLSDASLDLSNRMPLTIGFGAHDYFRGKMSDLRLYGRALQHEEVQRLAPLRSAAGQPLTQ